MLPMTFYYVAGTARIESIIIEHCGQRWKRNDRSAVSRETLVQTLYSPIAHTLASSAREICWICWLGGWSYLAKQENARQPLSFAFIKEAEVSFRSLQLNTSTPSFQQFLVCNAVCSTSIKPAITFSRFGFFVSTSDSTNRRSDDKFFEFDAFQVCNVV